MNNRYYDTKTDTIKSVAIHDDRFPILLADRLDYIIRASKIAVDEINELAEIDSFELWRERAETLKKNAQEIERWFNELRKVYLNE
jgi:hypothetical protein